MVMILLIIEYTTAKSTSLAIQFGVIFKIHAGEVIDLGPNKFELPIRTITLSLGLAYRFN